MKKIFSGLFGLIFMLFAGCSTGETIVYVQSTTEDATVVKYYKQSLYNNYEFYEQENINLKAGTKLSDITKTYDHYVPKGFSQNGNVLSVFFDRQTYTLTFKADGKVFKTVSGIYETNVILTGLGEPYSLTRHFNRWLGEDGNDAVFPTTFTENITYNAEMHDGVQITINYAGDNVPVLLSTKVYCHTGLSQNNVPVLDNIVSSETGEVTSYFNGWRLGSVNGAVMSEGSKLDGNEISVIFYAKWSSQQYIGRKGPTETRAVGDIIFTDGSACPYTATLTDEQKSQAVSIIFYAGTESEYYYKYLGNKPRGVALNITKDEYYKALNSAEGWNFLANNSYLDYYYDEAKKGHLEYVESNNSDFYDGLKVRDYLKENFTDYPSSYPACAYCEEYNKNEAAYNKDWYVPSFAELDCLYGAKVIVNQAFISLGRDTTDTILKQAYMYEYVWDITNNSGIYVFLDYTTINDGASIDSEFCVIPIHQF